MLLDTLTQYILVAHFLDYFYLTAIDGTSLLADYDFAFKTPQLFQHNC